MPPKAVTLAAFLPSQLKAPEPAPEPIPGQPRPVRCRCEGHFDLCWRYPAGIANAACKPRWDKLLAPFQFKGREWTIVELRSLWPHTVQALNERLLKGRIERTLKEDLQDDLQVLVDLIQHSCKPHPRPPRAGMKTLIVQGRILAEAIAQDALFQLDPPSDPAAPRPDRDLVDLINRLRERHPDSLLGPALHGLRCLGNTAVHLDRDSARLTDGEIGDAAAVCCRLVVHVVDAYMHLCANLHRHEDAEEALAQPLLDAPVAPLPAPNVLLRQRDTTPSPPTPLQLQPQQQQQQQAEGPAPAASLVPAAPPRPPLISPPPEPVLLLSRQGHASGGSGRVEDGLAPAPSGLSSSGGGSGRRDSSSAVSGGGRPSNGGSADGVGRVPYSLVSCERTSAGGGGDGGGACPGEQPGLESRGWWPRSGLTEPPVAPLLPTPLALLRRAEASYSSGLGFADVPAAAPREAEAPPQPVASSTAAANWVREHPMPYGLPGGAFWSAPGGGCGGGGGFAAIVATAPGSSDIFGRRSSGGDGGSADGNAAAASAPGQHPTVPYSLAAGAKPQAAAGAAVCGFAGGTAPEPDEVITAAAAQQLPVDAQRPADGSPRRCPLYLTPDGESATSAAAGASTSAKGIAHCARHTAAAASASAASWSFPVRGGSPQRTLFEHNTPAAHGPPLSQASQQCQQHQRQQQQALPGTSDSSGAAPGAGAGPGNSGSGAALSLGEASKRLLQLCATATAPPASKVAKLLQAGAALSFTDKTGMTALHMACYWAHVEAVRLLLAHQPGCCGTADREGRTPLWVAAQRGHLEVAEMLLGLPEGAALVDAGNAAGVTPLRVASAQGHSGVVAALLRSGARVDQADKDGFTPLYVAAARSQLEVVRLLLAAGAPADRADKAGRTPLWAALHPGGAARAEACPERRGGVVRALLGAGADVYLLTDSRDRDYCWQVLAQSIAAGD